MVPRAPRGLDTLFALAERKGWDLDFHVDESADPAARSLRVVADMAIARALSRPHPGRPLLLADAARTTTSGSERSTLVARAGISVVSLPMCNLFLQDRHAGLTPRWRGVTALHELKAAGVNVMIASDNTRDPFYAYGDLDMLEVWREGVRILHLDYPFAAGRRRCARPPAQAMGVDMTALRAGARADLILTRRARLHRAIRPPAGRPHRAARAAALGPRGPTTPSSTV